MLTENQKRFAEILVDRKTFPRQLPLRFGSFKLKHHEKYPDAPLSPVYVDLRLLQSRPAAMRAATALLKEKLLLDGLYPYDSRFNLIAGVPLAAVQHAANLSQAIDIGCVTPREAKSHGAAGTVNGDFETGQMVLVVEDTVTSGESILEAAQILRRSNLFVGHALALVDREQGAKEYLWGMGVNLHAGLTLNAMLMHYLDSGLMSHYQFDDCMIYQSDYATYFSKQT